MRYVPPVRFAYALAEIRTANLIQPSRTFSFTMRRCTRVARPALLFRPRAAMEASALAAVSLDDAPSAGSLPAVLKGLRHLSALPWSSPVSLDSINPKVLPRQFLISPLPALCYLLRCPGRFSSLFVKLICTLMLIAGLKMRVCSQGGDCSSCSGSRFPNSNAPQSFIRVRAWMMSSRNRLFTLSESVCASLQLLQQELQLKPSSLPFDEVLICLIVLCLRNLSETLSTSASITGVKGELGCRLCIATLAIPSLLANIPLLSSERYVQNGLMSGRQQGLYALYELCQVVPSSLHVRLS